MRVGSLQMTTRYLNQLNRTYENQTKLMEQSDGAKLHRPSDDPIGYSKYLRYSTSYGENNQYQTNVKTAISWMKNSDSSLVDITNCFKTVVVKTNQAQGTNTDTDMKAIAQEMLVQVQQSVADANIQINGRYLFSGQRDLVQPYSISYEQKFDRGLTKTLDDKQADFFSDVSQSGAIKQMLQLQGDDGNRYFLNTKTGRVYTQDFVDEGYKEKIAEGQSTANNPIASVNAGDGVQADNAGAPENTNYHHYEQRIIDELGPNQLNSAFAAATGLTDQTMVVIKDGAGNVTHYGDSTTGKVYEKSFVDNYMAGDEIKSVGTYPSGAYKSSPRISSDNAPERYNAKSYGMYVLKGVDGSTYFAEPSTGAITDEAHIASASRPLKFEQANSENGSIIGDLYAQNQKYKYDSVVKMNTTVVIPPGVSQKDYFGAFGETDFVKVKDADGKFFYYSPTTHDVYTADFFEKDWKESNTTKVKTIPYYDKGADAVDSMDAFSVAENFDSRGVIKDDGAASGTNWKTSYIIDGRTVTMTLDTVSQYIVTYQGDKKQFSMVKENGEVQPATDTVNASGMDIAGYSIFDNPDSGNEYSGANAFNDMLTVVAMCDAGISGWMSSDGKTLANNAFDTVLNAESKLAARQQVYADCEEMLVTQNETILGDITDVHSTDVAKLAVEMMTAQTIYQLSLSVGSRILPPTLADYL